MVKHAISGLTWWIPKEFRTNAMNARVVRFWNDYLRECTPVIYHVAVDSKRFGSDVRFRESGASNKVEMVNLLPIVRGDFVAKTSVGGRTLSGRKHFGRRLIAVPGSETSWKCALGKRLNVRKFGRLDTTEDEVSFMTDDPAMVMGLSTKYMVCDAHMIECGLVAFVNYLHHKTDIDLLSEDFDIPDKIKLMISDDRSACEGFLPVMATRRAEYIVKDIKVKTAGQMCPSGTVLINNPEYAEVGAYASPQQHIDKIVMDKTILKVKDRRPVWDDPTKVRREMNRSQRRRNKAVVKYELRQLEL